MVLIEGTVPTGLEAVANEEVKERLGVTGEVQRGRVFFSMSGLDEIQKALSLRCFENMYVVMYRETGLMFDKEDKDQCISLLRDLLPDIDWFTGLCVWQTVFGPLPGGLERSLQRFKSYCAFRKDPTVDLPQYSGERPAFRASCNRAGSDHPFTSQEAAAKFGGEVQDYFGWSVSMKKFDVEIVLNISETTVYVGIPITKESLHKRNIQHFHATTLKSTICHAMLRIAHLKPGEIVCDPLCGCGGIPIEASLCWPLNYALAADISAKSIQKAAANVCHNVTSKDHSNSSSLEVVQEECSSVSSCTLPVDVIQWDSTNSPLHCGCVDCIVSDLPFGKRIGTRGNNRTLYLKLLLEFARITTTNGSGRAVLLTQDVQNMIHSMRSTDRYWHLKQTLAVNVGGIIAKIFVLSRTTATVS